MNNNFPLPPQADPNRPERIDFHRLGNFWQVNKFWTTDVSEGRMCCLQANEKPLDFDLEAALEWCEAHNYKVRRWPGGARAFLGKLQPVRTRAAIQQLRGELRDHPRPEVGMALNLDLAYDL